MTTAPAIMTLPQIAQLSGGDLWVKEVPRDARAREAFLASGISGATLDTRRIQPGELFVPLPGERTDGHDHIGEAFARGAGASLCDRAHAEEWQAKATGPLVIVADVTAGLQRLAARYREGWSGLLIGVTGSSGKTTTKDLVAAVLESAAPTWKTQGNLNNHWGVPLTLLGLRAEHQAAVIEMGMNHAGEIASLAAIARPTAAVITNAGTAHLEHLGSLEAIAREKASLAAGLGPDEIAFAGADSPRLIAALAGFRCRRLTYGLVRGADLRPERLEDLGEKGTRVSVTGFPEFVLGLAGRHQVVNALGALAVAREYHVPPEAAVAALAAVRPGAGRMEIRHARGATLLVDSYNANPDSVAMALETLARWPGAKRRIAALGDMLELGSEAGALHAEVARNAAKGVELWVSGAHAADYAKGARAARRPLREFETREALRESLHEALGSGVVVLIKASRGARFETLLEGLGAEG
jgi:UDP-N-acetylmuramoyl-tripeptide--D-alanyl-D-alanine ligase